MKLVDILARELKMWPEGITHLTQSSVDTEIYDAVNGKDTDNVYPLSPQFHASERHNEGSIYPVVTRAEWQLAVDELDTPKVFEWTGEGLPPVGTVCEWLNDEWTKVVIVGSHHGAAVAVDEIDPRRVFIGKKPCYRPIRTPEQIATEERVAAAQAWLKGIGQEYGQEIADKCEDILMQAEASKQVAQ